MLEILLSNDATLKWSDAGFSSPLGIAYGNACVLGKDVYFFGRDASNAWSDLYKLSGKTITRITAIPRPRFGMRMFGYGSDIYFIGTGATAEDRVLQRYNVTTNKWSNHTTYDKDLLWSSVCQNGPLVYITASGTNRNDNEVLCFDISTTDIVTKRFPVTNVNRAHMLIAAKDNMVYFGGGFRDIGSFEVFSDFYSLDVNTGTQEQLEDMPEVGYFAMTYGSLESRLIALNPLSGTNATATATHSNKVMSFNYRTKTWSYEQETETGYSHAACFTLNNKFTRISGRNTTKYTRECITLS